MLDRNELIQQYNGSAMPQDLRLRSSRLCGTLSNALVESKYIMSTVFYIIRSKCQVSSEAFINCEEVDFLL